jgi:hypothetical protein
MTAGLRISALAGAMALEALAAYWSLRLAWADQLSNNGDAGWIEEAIRLSPGNAGFQMKLAQAMARGGGDPSPALTAAARLNPGNPGVWMRLGLNAEVHGDFAQAEQHLLHATQVSRQFEPRWTLANYYCRRNDAARFWPSARQALIVGYGDLSPVFDLCWRMSQDGDAILSQAIPEDHSVLGAYLQFLVRAGRLQAATTVAGRLAPHATEADSAALLAWCDRMLESHEAGPPLNVWNTMCRRRLLPYAPLDPPHGASLTNGAFAADSTGGGFDWRLQPSPGVTCGRNASPQYLSITFYGNEPASCEPLTQYLALVPGAHYRLRYEYRTSDLAAESGLRWQVLNAATGSDLASLSPWLSSPRWKSDAALFTAPADGPLARLALRYQRTPGTPRLDGSVLLRRVELERMP